MHVYKARAIGRRNGYRMFISVYTLCSYIGCSCTLFNFHCDYARIWHLTELCVNLENIRTSD